MGSDTNAKARRELRRLVGPAAILVIYTLWLFFHYRGQLRRSRKPRRQPSDKIFDGAFDRASPV